MSKDVPYFRFTPQEWQNGIISDLPDSIQGFFIQVCCFYWLQDCKITEERLIKRFPTKIKSLNRLQNANIIKTESGQITIRFLSEQWENINKSKSYFSEMGKLGQIVKKQKATLKPPLKPGLSNKDKDKDKDKDNILPQAVDTHPSPLKEKTQSTIPTLEEVTAYCAERRRGVNAARWYDFYSSKGWMIGKNKMKDWKAAVRTWEQNQQPQKPKQIDMCGF